MRERLLGDGPRTTPPPRTTAFIPIAEHTLLCRLVKRMLDAQQEYFEARKSQPYANHTAKLRAVKDLECRVRSAVADGLNRERQCLPGMDKT